MTSDESTFETDDPMGLQRALEVAGFRRDSKLGGILHAGKVSFREVSPHDSLHVVIDGNQVSAHVDRISPLHSRRRGRRRYSWTRVVAHNVAVLTDDISRRIRGLHGHNRCELDCEVVWVDDEDLSHPGDKPSPADDEDLVCLPTADGGPDNNPGPPSGWEPGGRDWT